MLRQTLVAHLFSTNLLRCGNTNTRSVPDELHAFHSPLDVLGLDSNASVSDVRKAYLDLAKVHHPDCGGCPKTFNRIHEAYDVCKKIISTRRAEDADTSQYFHCRPKGGYRHHPEPSNNMHRELFRKKKPSSAPGGPPPSKGADAQFWAEYKAQKIAELRGEFVRKFKNSKSASELDTLMEDALQSGCMTDRGEPLCLALANYHQAVGYGLKHVEVCFAAIDKWETLVGHQATNAYYQEILQLYTNNSQAAERVDYMTMIEVVAAVMDRMSAKGLAHDDYTYLLSKIALSSANMSQ